MRTSNPVASLDSVDICPLERVDVVDRHRTRLGIRIRKRSLAGSNNYPNQSISAHSDKECIPHSPFSTQPPSSFLATLLSDPAPPAFVLLS